MTPAQIALTARQSVGTGLHDVVVRLYELIDRQRHQLEAAHQRIRELEIEISRGAE